MSRMLKLSVVILSVGGLTLTAGIGSTYAQNSLHPESGRLDQLLHEWSTASSKVRELHGQHHRFVYDKVFEVEKRATGEFYYKAPSQGRIDLKPADIRNPGKRRFNDQGVPFKLQADRPERWVCDGQSIWQISDDKKQVDIFPIPPENQGQNIMDGPLPFLFGMPPEKAKVRYQLTLLQENEQFAWIKARPNLKIDAANWQEAKIILDKKMYLPSAVQLIDPSGNLETVYTFTEFSVNDLKPSIFERWFGGKEINPFRPDIPKDYNVKMHDPPAAGQPQGEQPPAGPLVPSVVNFPWKQAQALLEKAQCTVKFVPGKAAPQPQMQYVVYDQKPAPNTPLQKGMVVTLTVYNQVAAGNAAPQPAANGMTMPKVIGIYWKDAGQTLEAAGLKVKYVAGAAPPQADQLFFVYEQSIAAGQPVQAGAEVTLKVYNAPQAANSEK